MGMAVAEATVAIKEGVDPSMASTADEATEEEMAAAYPSASTAAEALELRIAASHPKASPASATPATRIAALPAAALAQSALASGEAMLAATEMSNGRYHRPKLLILAHSSEVT